MNGKELRAFRERLGLTQAEFGKLLGIGKMAVWRKENGQRAITPRDEIMVEGLRKKRR